MAMNRTPTTPPPTTPAWIPPAVALAGFAIGWLVFTWGFNKYPDANNPDQADLRMYGYRQYLIFPHDLQCPNGAVVIHRGQQRHTDPTGQFRQEEMAPIRA